MLALKLEHGRPTGPEMGLPRQGEGPSLNLPCRILGPKLVPTSYSVSAQDALTAAQPQLRLEHEQLSSLNGKGNCLATHWDVVLAVLCNGRDLGRNLGGGGREDTTLR
jgi:hypothetical protein